MQSADTYAYLNIDDPVCAWATYRGVLVSPPDTPGFVSVWLAGILKSGNRNRLLVEQKLEFIREKFFPSCVSRLRGMFCFMDPDSATLALSWGADHSNHFSVSNRATLDLSEAGSRRDRFDANWITWAHGNPEKVLKDDFWIKNYWSGKPYPGKHPIWETIVEGRLTVVGTALRKKAYGRIKDEFPDSLAFLEIARLAARTESDLGSICGFLKKSDKLRLDYLMNMQDAKDTIFLKRLKELLQSDHPINTQDLVPHFARDSFGCVPDLKPYSHSWELEG